MGFRNGSYMTVWSAEPSKSGRTTQVRLSSSRKNKTTNEYEQDFSAFCTFIGQAHEAAASLKEKDRLKILECDVCTSYDKEKNKNYTTFKVFDFEPVDGYASYSGSADNPNKNNSPRKKAALAEEGEVSEDNLPF